MRQSIRETEQGGAAAQGKDLVVLVADVQQKLTLATLLESRRDALGIRPVRYDIYHHPRRDSGVCHEAANFLSSYLPPQYERVLVVLDRDWEGAPGSAEELRNDVRGRLLLRGWPEEACEVIVIDPELEVWVWASTPVVAEVLRTDWSSIRDLARQRGYWTEGRIKPEKPKRLLEAVLRQQRRPRSSAIFQAIAERISLRHCTDPSFTLLRETLARWFPETDTIV